MASQEEELLRLRRPRKRKRGQALLQSMWQTDTKTSPFKFLGIEYAWNAILDLTDHVMGRTGGETLKIKTLPLDRPVKMAILDSGINAGHQAFRHGNIKEVKEFVSSRDNSHGTSVAGFAAGGDFRPLVDKSGLNTAEMDSLGLLGLFEGDDFETSGDFCSSKKELYSGIAPFCELYIGVVLEGHRGNTGSKEHLTQAIRWAVDKKVDIINVSMGSPFFDLQLQQAVLEALSAGVIVVASASNFGRCFQNSVSYPGRLGCVISVGSHDSYGEKSIYSAVGRELDFLAPGEGIWSPCGSCTDSLPLHRPVPPTSLESGVEQPAAPTQADQEEWNIQERGVTCAKGTSLSTPFVAGLCALVLAFAEKAGKVRGDPSLRERVSNTWVMKRLLLEMSRTPGHHDQVQGHGSLLPSRFFDLSPKSFQLLVSKIVSDVEVDADTRASFARMESVTRYGNVELSKLILRQLDHQVDKIASNHIRSSVYSSSILNASDGSDSENLASEMSILDFSYKQANCPHQCRYSSYPVYDILSREENDTLFRAKPFLIIMPLTFTSDTYYFNRQLKENTNCFVLTSQWSLPQLDSFFRDLKQNERNIKHVHVEKLIVKDMNLSNFKLRDCGIAIFFDKVDDQRSLEDFLTRTDCWNVHPSSRCERGCLEKAKAKPYFSLQEYLKDVKIPPTIKDVALPADVAVEVLQLEAISFPPRLQVVDLRDRFWQREEPTGLLKYPGSDIVKLFDALSSRKLTADVLYLPDNLIEFDRLEEILSHPFLGGCNIVRLQKLFSRIYGIAISLRDLADFLYHLSKSGFRGAFNVDHVDWIAFDRRTFITEPLKQFDLKFEVLLTYEGMSENFSSLRADFHDADGSVGTVLAVMETTGKWSRIWSDMRQFLQNYEDSHKYCGVCHVTVGKLKSMAKNEIVYVRRAKEPMEAKAWPTAKNNNAQRDKTAAATTVSKPRELSAPQAAASKDTYHPQLTTSLEDASTSSSSEEASESSRQCPPNSGYQLKASDQARPLHVVFMGYGFPLDNNVFLRPPTAVSKTDVAKNPMQLLLNGQVSENLERAGIKAIRNFLPDEEALMMEDKFLSIRMDQTRKLTEYMRLATLMTSELRAGQDVCFSCLQVIPSVIQQKESQGQNNHDVSVEAMLAAVRWLLKAEIENPSLKADVVVFPRGVPAFSKDLYQAFNQLLGRGRVLLASAHLDSRGDLTMPACLGDVICVAEAPFTVRSSCLDLTTGKFGQEVADKIRAQVKEKPPGKPTFDYPSLQSKLALKQLPEDKFRRVVEQWMVAQAQEKAYTHVDSAHNKLLESPEFRQAMEVAAVAGVAVRLISMARSLDKRRKTAGKFEAAMCTTELMRRALHDMCDNYGQHSETRGYGDLRPDTFFSRGFLNLENFLCNIAPHRDDADDDDNDDDENDE